MYMDINYALLKYTENKKFSQYFNVVVFVIYKILIYSYIEICWTKFVAFIKRTLNLFNILTKKLFSIKGQ